MRLPFCSMIDDNRPIYKLAIYIERKEAAWQRKRLHRVNGRSWNGRKFWKNLGTVAQSSGIKRVAAMIDWSRLGSLMDFCAVYYTTQLVRCAAFSLSLIHI